VIVEQIASVGEYGLAGAVIVALFYTLKVLGTLGLEKFEAVIQKFSEDAKAIRDEHRSERSEWRSSQEKRDECLDVTIIGLTEAIRQSRGNDNANRN
jgi:hypothetical protein